MAFSKNSLFVHKQGHSSENLCILEKCLAPWELPLLTKRRKRTIAAAIRSFMCERTQHREPRESEWHLSYSTNLKNRTFFSSNILSHDAKHKNQHVNFHSTILKALRWVVMVLEAVKKPRTGENKPTTIRE